MNISRDNYEEVFMLYADNELSAQQKLQVEEFVAGNPDLKQELELFLQFKLSPDESVVFTGKAELLKPETETAGITQWNYESYFVLYGDGELTSDEKAGVENFVYRNPALQKEFELLQQARLNADPGIVFANKENLYRREKDEKVIPFRWWRMAVAAAVLLAVPVLFWLNSNTRKNDGQSIAVAGKPAEPVKQITIPGTRNTAAGKVVEEQNTRPAIAATAPRQNIDGQKKTRQVAAAIAISPVEIKNINSNIDDQPNVIPAGIGTSIAEHTIKSTAVDPVMRTHHSTEIKRPLIAVATQPMIDQPALILNPDENKTQVEYASLNNDNVEVLNTTVNTKNALRGLLKSLPSDSQKNQCR